MTATKTLAIVELVIYLIIVPVIVFILYHHGLPGLLGWIFLVAFSTLRIASDGIEIGNSNPGTSTGGSIINAIGLSPLMLTVSGIIHESQVICPSHLQISNANRKLAWAVQLILHLLIVVALDFSAIGGSKLSFASSTNDFEKDYDKLKVGACLFVLLSLVLTCYVVWVLHRLRRPSRNPVSILRSPNETVLRAVVKLAYAVAVAVPLVVVRTVYSVVYAFDHNPLISPTTGSFGVKFTLAFLVPLIAVLTLITGGLLTVNMRMEGDAPSGWSAREARCCIYGPPSSN